MERSGFDLARRLFVWSTEVQDLCVPKTARRWTVVQPQMEGFKGPENDVTIETQEEHGQRDLGAESGEQGQPFVVISYRRDDVEPGIAEEQSSRNDRGGGQNLAAEPRRPPGIPEDREEGNVKARPEQAPVSGIIFSGKGQPQEHCPWDKRCSGHHEHTRHDLDTAGQQKVKVVDRNRGGPRLYRFARMVFTSHHPIFAPDVAPLPEPTGARTRLAQDGFPASTATLDRADSRLGFLGCEPSGPPKM